MTAPDNVLPPCVACPSGALSPEHEGCQAGRGLTQDGRRPLLGAEACGL